MPAVTAHAGRRARLLDGGHYGRIAMRVLPHWPDSRYLELAPNNWARTRAKLLPAELDAPVRLVHHPGGVSPEGPARTSSCGLEGGGGEAFSAIRYDADAVRDGGGHAYPPRRRRVRRIRSASQAQARVRLHSAPIWATPRSTTSPSATQTTRSTNRPP